MKDKFTIYLTAPGNPDHQQFADVADPMPVKADSLRMIVDVCQRYISENNLGSGNWPMPEAFKNGKPFALIAYNLRVFDNVGKEIVIE